MKNVRAFLQQRHAAIVDIATEHGTDEKCPTIAVVVGPGTKREFYKAFGARRAGDVVAMPSECAARISAIDEPFARWARRVDSTIRVFYTEGPHGGNLLLNLRPEAGGIHVSIEPGSTDEARQAAAS